LSISSNRLFQLFKYSVYALLAFNIYAFWSEEVLAAAMLHPGGISLAELIGSFPATIDTAAWVVLLLMFELETYVLEDRHYNRAVTLSLHAVRIFCYAFIVYALYGYVVKLLLHYDVVPMAGLSDLCSLAADGWSYAIDLDDFSAITAANCGSFSTANSFLRFESMPAVVDAAGLADIRILAWVDVINAAIWLLVVVVLEVDVRLQERDRLKGEALRISNAVKFVLYGMLLLAAIYWGIKGDFIDFWDAFLWLVAFVLIELNVFEWRHEANESAALNQS
jgi:hypothetical protein